MEGPAVKNQGNGWNAGLSSIDTNTTIFLWVNTSRRVHNSEFSSMWFWNRCLGLILRFLSWFSWFLFTKLVHCVIDNNIIWGNTDYYDSWYKNFHLIPWSQQWIPAVVILKAIDVIQNSYGSSIQVSHHVPTTQKGFFHHISVLHLVYEYMSSTHDCHMQYSRVYQTFCWWSSVF